MKEHIHTPYDGRGLRKVFVDGVEVPLVNYANLKLGIVHAFIVPHQLNRRHTYARRYKLRGNVTIEPIK